MDEDGVGAKLAHSLQQVDGTSCVDGKVVQWPPCGQVVTRLRRTVDDQIEGTFLPQHTLQRLAIPYVNVIGSKVSRALHEPTDIPASIALRTEKSARMLLSMPITDCARESK